MLPMMVNIWQKSNDNDLIESCWNICYYMDPIPRLSLILSGWWYDRISCNELLCILLWTVMKFFITSLFYQIRTFAFTKCFCIFIIGIHVALSLFWFSDYSCLLKYKYATSSMYSIRNCLKILEMVHKSNGFEV